MPKNNNSNAWMMGRLMSGLSAIGGSIAGRLGRTLSNPLSLMCLYMLMLNTVVEAKDDSAQKAALANINQGLEQCMKHIWLCAFGSMEGYSPEAYREKVFSNSADGAHGPVTYFGNLGMKCFANSGNILSQLSQLFDGQMPQADNFDPHSVISEQQCSGPGY